MIHRNHIKQHIAPGVMKMSFPNPMASAAHTLESAKSTEKQDKFISFRKHGDVFIPDKIIHIPQRVKGIQWSLDFSNTFSLEKPVFSIN